MLRLSPGLALLAAVTACGGIHEDDFTTRLAVAECRTIERCARGLFEANFTDMGDCVDAFGDALDDWVDELKSCDYDPDEARRCVSRVRSMDCNDWVRGDDERACDLVYDCTR